MVSALSAQLPDIEELFLERGLAMDHSTLLSASLGQSSPIRSRIGIR